MIFFYKQYKESAAATLANAFIRMIGFFSLFGVYFCFEESNIIGMVIFIILIIASIPVSNIVGNSIYRKKMLKIEGKQMAKEAELVPMKQETVEENGVKIEKEVPDIVEGEFTYPAKITIVREKSFVGCAVKKITYEVNDSFTCKLSMNESETYTTVTAVNTVRGKAPAVGDKTTERPIQVIVRPGESVTLFYRMHEFMRVERSM